MQQLDDCSIVVLCCDQARKLQKQGWTLVDVRLATDFERFCAEGSVNVPMYRCVMLQPSCAGRAPVLVSMNAAGANAQLFTAASERASGAQPHGTRGCFASVDSWRSRSRLLW
jgi:rhodanese-related sulfurtransferase